jgi:tetratricopeptide (TPR) repeat protein
MAEGDYAESIVAQALGDMERCIAMLERSVKCDPDYAPAVMSLASVEYQRGRREEGWKLMERLAALPAETKDLAEILDEAGSFLVDRRNYRDGSELFKRASARFPGVAALLEGLGCCASHLNLHAESIAASRAALVLEPDNPVHLNDLGWSLFLEGQLEESRNVLRRALELKPDYATAKENLRLAEEGDWKRFRRLEYQPAPPPAKPRKRKRPAPPPDGPWLPFERVARGAGAFACLFWVH